ncbi:MAG TPA: sigma-70 family RNA polymerase sigma factor [Thermoanaerobaculia bacterium]|nr:sigma-70 family RNA polymerase sigma factor [Thermoanaerobaculia bacterium]
MRGDHEALLVRCLPLVERLSRFFCRGSRMTAEDVEDFIGHVRLHLIDDDYAVLRSFEGRCSLETFLALTIQRQLFDYRARLWGRFRTSVAATRLGPAAIRLETLVVRDRKSIDEAVSALAQEGHGMTRAEAERLAAEFPERRTRAVETDLDDVAKQLAIPGDAIEQNATSHDRQTAKRKVTGVMREAMTDLPAEDRTILRLHFDAGLSVADIARATGLEQRPLYRRLSRIFTTLRERLLASGVDPGAVQDLLGRADTDFDFGLREVANSPAVPSTSIEDVKR